MTVQTTAETSNNEDALDTDEQAAFDELANDDTGFGDLQDDDDQAGDTEETDESTEDDEATDSDDDTEEESADDDTESTESEDAEDTEDTGADAEDKAAEEKLSKEDAAKAAFQKREEKRLAQKAQSQQDYLQGAEEVYDKAINAGMSPELAKMEVNRERAVRQLQVDAYNNQVASTSNSLQSALTSAVQEIDLFKSKNRDVQAAMLKAVDTFEELYVIKDANGDPIEVKGDLRKYLQEEADSIRKLTGVGAKQQKDDKSNQKKRTFTPPTRSPRKKPVDEGEAAFDEEASRY